ncbi:MAG: hypothetical protein ACK5MA_00710 [Parachlamydiaceae bacterium]
MSAVENQATFQVASRGAYTHGLEEIYKVETVDLKSVRRMEAKETTTSPIAPAILEPKNPQLPLDFGPGYREWMTPFIDKEPIQVLDYNKQLEKWLLENGYNTIGALRHADLLSEPFVRKLGQGHREEVALRLNEYLKNKPVKETISIDFLSLLKCVVGRLEKKKLFVALKPLNLEEWITLSPMDQVDVKRIGKHEQSLWAQEVKKGMDAELLSECFGRIAASWLIPWIEKRSGVADREEIKDYMLLRSSDAKAAEQVLSYFFYPVEKMVPHSLDSLFFSSEKEMQRFERLKALLLTYFPTSYSRYKIEDLYRFSVAELGEPISMPFFKKVLKFSKPFRVVQDFVEKGDL